jgi:excisionase family DNA binding protein
VLGTRESIEKVGRRPRVDASVGDSGAPRGLTRSELMTAREVADLLDVPISTVHDWGRKGTLPRVKLGRHVRIIRSQVEETIFGAANDGPRPGERVQISPLSWSARALRGVPNLPQERRNPAICRASLLSG